MCTSAIRYAGFREYIYATTIDHLVQVGWSQILIPSQEVIERSWLWGTGVKVLGSVGADFTDPLFEWQYQDGGACPKGCSRSKGDGGKTCTASSSAGLTFQ
jgi:tRNA(Arg) A34 adenosine deaminase TadA